MRCWRAPATMIELRRPYVCVQTGRTLSCGGSQNWFPDRNFRSCGCGVIACADTLLYLQGREVLEREEYTRYVNLLRRFFPLIPRHGIDGVRLALGMNLCLRRDKLPFRAGWGVSGGRFWDKLAGMLADDVPGIIAIGPNFPKVWGTERLTLWRAAGDGYAEAERTKAHFLTVTGLDDERMRVSSWGRELFILRSDYERYMRQQSVALFTNLLSIRKI